MTSFLLQFQTLYLKRDWTDELIYPEDMNNVPEVTLTDTITSDYPFLGNDNLKIYAKECLFFSCTNRVMEFNNWGDQFKVLIELSAFHHCTSPEYGGAILQFDGYFVMNKCCAVRCYNTYFFDEDHGAPGQFLWTSSIDCTILDSSISFSYNVEQDSETYSGVFNVCSQDVLMKIVNITKNKIHFNAAFTFSINNKSANPSVSFATINENNAFSTICSLGNYANSHEFLYSNLIDNICTDTVYGMISTMNKIDFKHCCLYGNQAQKWFQTFSYDGYTGIITIINCTIKEEDLKKSDGSVPTEEWMPISSFFNDIKYTDTKYCHLSYEDLTPPNIPNTFIYRHLSHSFLTCFASFFLIEFIP